MAQSPTFSHVVGVGGTGRDVGKGVVDDVDGNSYVVGDFQGTVDFDNGPGTAALVCAGSSPANPGNGDGFVASYDLFGGYRWAFQIGSTAGGSSVTSIDIDPAGDIVVGGWIFGVVDFDPGVGVANRGTANMGSFFVARYTASGGHLWSFAVVGDPRYGYFQDRAIELAVGPYGEITITGTYAGSVDFDPGAGRATMTSVRSGSQHTYDIFIARFSSAGNFQWARSVGGAGGEIAEGVALDGSGNICITGWFLGTADFNPGKGVNNLTAATKAMFVAKYSSNGTYAWAFAVQSPGMVEGNGIAVDGAGNVTVTGWLGGTADFDPGSGTATLTGHPQNGSVHVARYSPAGTYLWAYAPGRGWGRAVAIDDDGGMIVTGNSYPENDFDPGAGTTNLPMNGMFLAKYSTSGDLDWAIGTGDTLGMSIGFGICTGGNGHTVVGRWSGSVDFDHGEGSTRLSSTLTSGNGISMDIFAARYLPGAYFRRAPRTSGNDPATLR